jgi:GH24 family phage-related lysozyme (muramidase)
MKIIITENQLKRLINEGLADDSEFQEMVKSWEGSVIDPKTKLHVTYDDETMRPVSSSKQVQGTMTIGYGTTKSIYPDMKPGEKIPETKAEKLLRLGIQKEENNVKRLIPSYDSLPRYVRMALLNAKYRGDLGPKTIKLINDGNWDQVSKEYLTHPNYTNPGNLRGVVIRMKSNADAFQKYAKELKKGEKEIKNVEKEKEPKDSQQKDNCTKYKLSDINWIKCRLYNKKAYAGKTVDTDFVNIRTTPEVNDGYISNKITTVKNPQYIGIVKGVEKKGLDRWLYIELDPSLGVDEKYGWTNYKYTSVPTV